VKTEETVAHATAGLRGQNSESDKLAADLVAGRAVMPEIRFDGATDQLSAGSEAHIGHLAQTLKSQPGSFLIEVHVDASGDIVADKALSDRRATVIKSHLMTQGVPPERVFVMGLGAARPLTTPTSSNARIEVARIQ
jgi:outer membrane protein OmpA-like peptidoglycan-associated protein